MDPKRFLGDCKIDNAFWFNKGVNIRNIYELLREIKICTEEEFKIHCSKDRDDFALWIGGVLENIELSKKLRNIKDKKQYEKTIEQSIKNVEKWETFYMLKNFISEEIIGWFVENRVLLKISSIIIVILIISVSYTTYNTALKLDQISDRLTSLDTKDSCYNNYFNQKILETRSIIDGKTAGEFKLECEQNNGFVIADINFESIPERIRKENIEVRGDRIIISVSNTSWAIYKNTSSMIPIINQHTKGIEIKPRFPEDVFVGSIISYKSGNDLIIHRVVEKGYDGRGAYFITKGDNNKLVDPEKVRFDQINGILVAVIY